MEPKTLLIPRIETLDNLCDSDAIINVLDERGARKSVDCLNWASTYPYRPLTTFAVAHSGTRLYVDFLVRANYLRAENSADQSPVSEDSCVEVFLQPEEGGEYWNFEFNCIGAINASHRIVRPDPTRLTTQELAQVVRHASCGNRPFKEVEGLFTWNLLVIIPFSLMGMEPPVPGTTMRGNFYKCASATSQPHFLSWNPIDTPKPDFHRPEFFGQLILE